MFTMISFFKVSGDGKGEELDCPSQILVFLCFSIKQLIKTTRFSKK